jgi:Cu/Ag efflux protein CusF
MKNKNCFILNLLLSLLTGCAAYQIPPLTVEHPAHPEAEVAPARPITKTLAYTSSDVPLALPITSGPAREDGHEPSHEMEAQTQQAVIGEGKVIATVPNANQLVIEHGEIKGFMDAMTMGYQVNPPSLIKGLKSGDKIRFTIDVQRKTIIRIDKLNNG